MEKPNLTTSIISILSFLFGAWLVFDGARRLLTGYYAGEQTIGLGPWATIFSAIGMRSVDMALPFVFLGVIWVVNGVIVLLGPARDTSVPLRFLSLHCSTPYQGPSSALWQFFFL